MFQSNFVGIKGNWRELFGVPNFIIKTKSMDNQKFFENSYSREATPAELELGDFLSKHYKIEGNKVIYEIQKENEKEFGRLLKNASINGEVRFVTRFPGKVEVNETEIRYL